MSKHRWESADEAWEVGARAQEQGKLLLALEAYEYAARRGHVAAQINLGNILDDEISPANPAAAVYWYMEAARQGESVAAWNLAMHFKRQNDSHHFVYWLQVAAQRGDTDAQEVLRGNPSEKPQ